MEHTKDLLSNPTSKKYRKSSLDPFLVEEPKRLGSELALRCLNMLELLLYFRLRNNPLPLLKSKYEIMRVYRETLIQKHRLLQRYIKYGLKRFEFSYEREAFFKTFVMTWNANKPESVPNAGPLLRDEKKNMRRGNVISKKVPRILS